MNSIRIYPGEFFPWADNMQPVDSKKKRRATASHRCEDKRGPPVAADYAPLSSVARARPKTPATDRRPL